MKVSKTWLAGTICALFFSLNSFAASSQDKEAAINSSLTKIGLQVEGISATPLSGLNQVLTNRGVFYVSDDGQYFIQGRLFEIDENGKPTNLTKSAQNQVRINGVKKFEETAIVYPAKDEKYEITVFTDITCTYCQKLHSEIKEFNDLGITVKYLAFPRGGLQSQSYANLQSVWCSDDKQAAMTKAKAAGTAVEAGTCENPVAEHYALGQSAGVTGTPAIVLPNGSLVPGYKPAPLILEELEK